MNLGRNPSAEELRSLFFSRQDHLFSHLLWVGRDGEVHLDMVPPHRIPTAFAASLSHQALFYFEAFERGGGRTGARAARDDGWMSEVYYHLVKHWAEHSTGFIDLFKSS